VTADTPLTAPPVQVATESVPEGKVVDFLTGKHVRDTPEEYIRQNIEKALVRQYLYDPGDCAPEFPIKLGSGRKRVDIVINVPAERRGEVLRAACVDSFAAFRSELDRVPSLVDRRSRVAQEPLRQ
jgi:type I restriction enzyme M protein